jgi:hypothetical protein
MPDPVLYRQIVDVLLAECEASLCAGVTGQGTGEPSPPGGLSQDSDSPWKIPCSLRPASHWSQPPG